MEQQDTDATNDAFEALKREHHLLSQIDALQKEITNARSNSQPHSSSQKATLLQSPDCERNLRKFIDSNLIAILHCKLTGEMLEANEAAAKLLGYSREELSNGTLNAADFTPPEYVHLDTIAFEQLRELFRAQPWEKGLLRKDGTLCSVLIGGVTSLVVADEIFAFVLYRTPQTTLEKELRAC